MCSEQPLVDQSTRDAIRTKLDVTMLVEAAAGTGKTTSLVARMVELVKSGVPVEEIAAITFTIKAAANLREKFQEKLESELRDATGDDRELLRAAVQELDSAFVGTIHSFCARLLRERPVEAGLDPAFKELEEEEAAEGPGRFWDEWVQRLFATNDPILGELFEAGVQPSDLRQTFARLCQYPDVLIPADKQPRPNAELKKAVDQVREFVTNSRPHWPQFSGSDEDDKLAALLRSLDRRLRFLPPDDDIAAVEFLEKALANGHVTQKKWPDKVVAKRLGEDYEVLQDGLLSGAVTAWREYVYPIAIGAMLPALAAFRDLRRREGKLTFQDLLMEARELLRDHPPVRQYFQRRFRKLLVDEFQDTDPIQAEIILFLTSDDLHEKDWRRLHPREGALFIVGDPKQSIYRFRRADITTYNAMQRIILDSGGGVKNLTTNFRSVPQICEWVNGFFRNVFTGDAVTEGRQARHVDVEAFRQTVVDGGVFSSVIRTTGRTGGAANIVAQESEILANWIRAAVDSRLEVASEEGVRPARFGDFLLIARVTTKLADYTRALEQKGIPYEVTGGKAFKDSQELARLLPFLRAVTDPDDSISIVAWLRGEYCGVDDQALYEYSRDGGKFSVFGKRAEGTDARIARALDLLRKAVDWSRALPPGAALARILDRLGIIAAAVTSPNGGTAAGNLLKVLAIARDLSARGSSLKDIVEELTRIVEEKVPREEMDIDPAREDVVRVMNLHQAKGLEAPFVFLIAPVGKTEWDAKFHIDRSGAEPLGYFPLFVKIEGSRVIKEVALPKGWARLAQDEDLFVAAEEERLLYVAATRAKNLLCVGVEQRQTQKKVSFHGPWCRFADSIDKPLPTVKAPGRVPVSIVAADLTTEFDRDQQARVVARDKAAVPTYAVSLVTKVAHASGSEMAKLEEGLGRGTSWGRVMHRLLEALQRDEGIDLACYAENLLKDEEREPAELPVVLKVIDGVRKSPVWDRLKRADERLMEVPFGLMVPNRELGTSDDGETLMHGVVDLVFREGDEWFVVDYKSDTIAGRLESLVRYYRPQVEHYARFWSKLTNRKTSAGLFFVDGAEMVWVS